MVSMPSQDVDVAAAVAERLLAARRTRRPIAPVRHDLPPKDVAAAYAVQRLTVAHLERAGHRRVGRKIGLTSEAVSGVTELAPKPTLPKSTPRRLRPQRARPPGATRPQPPTTAGPYGDDGGGHDD